MSDQFTRTLSASRIKTFKACSWLYAYKYQKKLPDQSNLGAQMGSCAHAIYEVLGNLRHVHHFYKVTGAGTIQASPAITRMVKMLMVKYSVPSDNLELLDKMIVNGLNHDFFGQDYGDVSESFSELDFIIEKHEVDKSYRVQGFIDKLFLYKDKKTALIRDFKTSKVVFEGDEVNDNIQDKVYRLAVQEKFPWVEKINVEFLFVKPEHVESERHVVKTPNCGQKEIDELEKSLTEVQGKMENFSGENEVERLASYMGRPKPEEGFCKSLLCGFAKVPGQVKKDGSPYFSCLAKWAFDYYALYDDKKVLVRTSKVKEDLVPLKKKGWKIKKEHYDGCPAFNGKVSYKPVKAEGEKKEGGFDIDDFLGF